MNKEFILSTSHQVPSFGGFHTMLKLKQSLVVMAIQFSTAPPIV